VKQRMYWFYSDILIFLCTHPKYLVEEKLGFIHFCPFSDRNLYLGGTLFEVFFEI